jgi:exonuclease VII small subunit
VKQATKDKKCLVKLKEILATLESGKDVPNRALKVWMDGDFDCIANEWGNYKSMQEYYADKPCEVEQYEDYFRKGMFDYNKAEGYSRKGNKAAEKFYNSSENKFETALEYLQGIVDKDSSLHGWFDRDVGWSEDNNIAPYPVSMPRVITSRSLDNLSAIGGLKKINVKINCVKGAIENLLNPTSNISTEEQARQLKKMLKRIKNKR